MNKTSFLIGGFATILLVSVGCGGGDEMTEPAGTQLSLVAETADPAADETTVFKVTASNAQSHIVSVALDYTDDGEWDEVRTVDASSVTESFNWIYGTSGHYTVRAEVREATNTPTTMTLPITVGEARNVAVSMLLTAFTAEGGPCYAYGPPACTGCATTLGPDLTNVVRRSLGMRQHGSAISVAQGFSQGPFTGGGDILYACSFTLRLVSGTPPYERAIGSSGVCATSSKVNPVILNCGASTSGVVP